MIEIYEVGVNAIMLATLILSGLVFLVYLIPFLVKYAKGNNVVWNDEYSKNWNPFTNNEFSTAFTLPVLFFVTGIIFAFTWIVTIPVLVIFIPLHLIRLRILHKQKMWDILRGVK